MFDILKKYLCCCSVNLNPNAKIDDILNTLEMDATIDRSRNGHHSFCVNEKSVRYINNNDKDSDDEL
uniref:Uncharacterized protein n=1 Tax=viral metagenome TaxID=1070528 RepID=A0A6C0LLV3_9ZZZZ